MKKTAWYSEAKKFSLHHTAIVTLLYITVSSCRSKDHSSLHKPLANRMSFSQRNTKTSLNSSKKEHKGHQNIRHRHSVSIQKSHLRVTEIKSTSILNNRSWTWSKGKIKLDFNKLRKNSKIKESWSAGKKRPKVFFVRYRDNKTIVLFVRSDLKIFKALQVTSSHRVFLDRTRSLLVIVPYYQGEFLTMAEGPISFYSLNGEIVAKHQNSNIPTSKNINSNQDRLSFVHRDFIYIDQSKTLAFWSRKGIAIAKAKEKKFYVQSVFRPYRRGPKGITTSDGFSISDFVISRDQSRLLISASLKKEGFVFSFPLPGLPGKTYKEKTYKCLNSKLFVGDKKFIVACYKETKHLLVEIRKSDLEPLWNRLFKSQMLHYYFHFKPRRLPLFFSPNDINVVLQNANTIETFQASSGIPRKKEKSLCSSLHYQSSHFEDFDIACQARYISCFYSSQRSLYLCQNIKNRLKNRWMTKKTDYRFDKNGKVVALALRNIR